MFHWPQVLCEPGFLISKNITNKILMNRVIFFVDGFNLYHALDYYKQYHKYKWLNLSKLANCFITKNTKIENIYYFTALTTWLPKKAKRQQTFIKALELENIKIVYGKFKSKDKFCRLCNRYYKTFEEKQTDVNIAIYLLRLAFENKYDNAIIISGDSDLIPSIKAVKNIFPLKKIGIIIPIGRRSEELKQICDFHMKMKEKHLKTCLFDREINLGNNKKLICPSEWI